MSSDHLDLEQLSAFVDGAEEGSDHIRTCEVCTARVERLRAVAKAVSTAPEPLADPERLVVGALQAGRTASVIPLRRRRAAAPVWLAAAAAVAALVVAAPLLMRDRDGVETAATTAREEREGNRDSLTADAAPGRGSRSFADLGDQTETGALESLVASAIAERAGRFSETESQATSENDSAAPRPPAADAPVCDAPRADLAAPIFTGTLRWRGTPAVLMAFDHPEGRRVLYVFRAADCSQLVERRF